MVAVPALTPVTTPEVAPTVAIVPDDDQVPPLTVLVSVILEPTLTETGPDIVPAEAGPADTVTTLLRKQPLPVV